MARPNLGIVPAWQFSPDPRVNPLLNPYANIPAGWASQSNPVQVAGIPTAGMTVTRAVAPVPSAQPQLGYQMVETLGIAPFDSFWWQHRKKLIIGGLAVLGLAGVALVSSVLR